jgi:hypothetical protein
MSAREPIFSVVPLGGALSGLLRLLLAEDQRDEFVGDLVEEARLRLRFCSPSALGAWIWMQALRSAPPLIGLRVRRWFSRPLSPALAGRPFGLRMQRALPFSLAVSLTVHAALAVTAVGWALFRDDVVDPPGPPEPTMAVVTDAPVVDEPAAPIVQTEDAPALRHGRTRRVRVPVATPIEPVVAPEPDPAPALPVIAAKPAPVTMVAVAPRPVRVPMQVAEKRCVSCPAPQLPPALARVGVEQQMVVKTCVGVNGEVTSVDVLRGFDQAVSERVAETVKGWRLEPYALDGHPVPFCYPTRFIFASR